MLLSACIRIDDTLQSKVVTASWDGLIKLWVSIDDVYMRTTLTRCLGLRSFLFVLLGLYINAYPF